VLASQTVEEFLDAVYPGAGLRTVVAAALVHLTGKLL
jgi:hypothetical protein